MANVVLIMSLAELASKVQDIYHYALAASGDDNSCASEAEDRPARFADALKGAKEIGFKLPFARLMGAGWVAEEIKRQAFAQGIDAFNGEVLHSCRTCAKRNCGSTHHRGTPSGSLYYECDYCASAMTREIEARTVAADLRTQAEDFEAFVGTLACLSLSEQRQFRSLLVKAKARRG